MMAWNNGFPASYQPMNFGYQPPVQTNSRMVEIVPVDSEESAAGWPVGVGYTQAMIAKDDSFIAFKTVLVNGQTEFTVYDKRPPAPPVQAFDPSAYVRRDELEAMLAALKKEDDK